MSKLYVKQIGSGKKTLILLHGWANTHKNMLPLGQLLAKNYQVHLVDLPGFGLSEKPDSIWGAKEYANILNDYMQEQAIEKAIFVGHSFGGKIALQIASDFPARVKLLVLIGSAGLPGKKTIKRRAVTLLGRVLGFFPPFYQRYFVPSFGSSDWKTAGSMRSILVKSIREDLSSLSKNLQVPTLILWGKRDTQTPLEMGLRFQKLIRGSRLIVYPQGDHYLMKGAGAHLLCRHIREEICKV